MGGPWLQSPVPGSSRTPRRSAPVAHRTLACVRRPYGSATLLASYDSDGPALYLLEPSGVTQRYFGTAVRVPSLVYMQATSLPSMAAVSGCMRALRMGGPVFIGCVQDAC